MGYEAEMVECDATLPAEHHELAYGRLLVAQQQNPDRFREGWLEPIKSYSNITEILNDLGFDEFSKDPGYQFTYYQAKWRDDVPNVLSHLSGLMTTTSPYVVVPFIEFVGEDHDRWRYEFLRWSVGKGRMRAMRPEPTQWKETQDEWG